LTKTNDGRRSTKMQTMLSIAFGSVSNAHLWLVLIRLSS
jgi:hypothetical protein